MQRFWQLVILALTSYWSTADSYAREERRLVFKQLTDAAILLGSDGNYHAYIAYLISNRDQEQVVLKDMRFYEDSKEQRLLAVLPERSLHKLLLDRNNLQVEDTLLGTGEERILCVPISLGRYYKKPELYFKPEFELLSKRTVKTKIRSIPVSFTKAPVEVKAPLRGKDLVVVDGIANHKVLSEQLRAFTRTSDMPINSQSYATSWLRLTKSGHWFTGSADKLTNWPLYASKVRAVGSGPIVKIENSFTDNPINSAINPDTVNTEKRLGNFIVQKLTRYPNIYAVYGNLKREGIHQRKIGQELKTGQVVALVGNSGTSQVPHLQFYLTAGPEPLTSPPIPFHLRGFFLQGRIDLERFRRDDRMLMNFEVFGPKGRKAHSIPLRGDVVSF